jgi:hypothetical protein
MTKNSGLFASEHGGYFRRTEFEEEDEDATLGSRVD